MLTLACCWDRSQAWGLACLQALRLNQTPHSECKHFDRVMRCTSTVPVRTKALSSLLLENHTNHHCKDNPQELDVTFVPLWLFIWITVYCFIWQIVVFLVGNNNATLSKFQQILWDKCLLLSQTSTVSGFGNILFCFSGSDTSKQGFPVIPRKINDTEESTTVLRANADCWLLHSWDE